MAVIVFSNLILCVQFISSYNENVYNVKTSTKSFFLTKIQNEIKNLECIEREISSQADLFELTNNNSEKAKSQMTNIVYSKVVSNVQPLQSLVFNTNGEIVYSSFTPSKDQTSALISLYKIYSKNQNETEFCFFNNFTKSTNEISFCTFKKLKRINYSTASYENYGYHCLLTSINLTEFFYGYDLVSDISITLFNDYFKAKVVYGNIGNLKLELGDTHIQGTDWHFDGYINFNFKNNSLFFFMIIVFFETLLLLLIIAFFLYDTNKKTLAPLQQIVAFLDSCLLNQRLKTLSISATSEIETIANALNNMIVKNKSLYKKILLNQEKLYEQEQTRIVTTMYALQSQVNPHFLYNTFEMLRSLAISNQVSEIEAITVYLAKILRYNLNTDCITSLKEEIEIIKCYISIMDVKYKDEFEIKYDIQKDIYDQNILRMIFQPIIENSFNHGFSVGEKKFKIILSAYTEEDWLILKVHDNGLGCSEKKLEQIRGSIYRNKIVHKHIGLSNLYHRLYLQYHSNFSMEFDSVEGIYTMVVVKIKLTS